MKKLVLLIGYQTDHDKKELGYYFQLLEAKKVRSIGKRKRMVTIRGVFKTYSYTGEITESDLPPGVDFSEFQEAADGTRVTDQIGTLAKLWVIHYQTEGHEVVGFQNKEWYSASNEYPKKVKCYAY